MARSLCTTLVLSLMVLFATSFAQASPVEFLNFNYLQDLQQVGNFYDGGSSQAQNLGIIFSTNFYGLKPISVGGSGNFTADPTGTPAIFINGTTGSMVTGTMNVTNGFSSGINFFYTAAFQETVKIWSGLGGTGSLLATITLFANDASCSGSYCNWTDVGANFSQVAKSVTFTGPANGMGIADITLGQSSTAIPEPSSLFLLATGLMGLCGYRGRRVFGI
jgi:hypothetical protein